MENHNYYPDTEGDGLRFAEGYLDHLKQVIDALSLEPFREIFRILKDARDRGRQVFLIGNGGSAATASHMANDLAKGAAKGGEKGLRAVALSDNVPLITAIANDESYENIFSGQLEILAEPADVLIVITGSGNSPNILKALQIANDMELTTIGFLGRDGGQAKSLIDIVLLVPDTDYGPIEDLHMVFTHLITAYFQRKMIP